MIDRPEDADRCRRLADRMRDAINRSLLDEDGYRDGLGSDHHAQHATAFPLALGLAPTDRLDDLGDRLEAGGMRVSIYAAQFLLDALCRAGRVSAAYGLMTATGTASWLHVLDDLGATLAPEAWDPQLKPNMTYSHAWGSAPINVIARWLLGVRVVAPGAAELIIEPRPGPLARMVGSVPTIRGDVGVDYDRAAGRLRIAVPTNTIARIRLHKEDLGISGAARVESGDGSAIDETPDRIEIAGGRPGEILVAWG